MFDDHQRANVSLSAISSYEVEDIEPQEDGKPLYVTDNIEMTHTLRVRP